MKLLSCPDVVFAFDSFLRFYLQKHRYASSLRASTCISNVCNTIKKLTFMHSAVPFTCKMRNMVKGLKKFV